MRLTRKQKKSMTGRGVVSFRSRIAATEFVPIIPPRRIKCAKKINLGTKAFRNLAYPLLPRCWYCGVALEKDKATVDHIHPLSRGGDNTFENLALACAKCNNEKDDCTLDELGWEFFDRPAIEPVRVRFNHVLTTGR